MVHTQQLPSPSLVSAAKAGCVPSLGELLENQRPHLLYFASQHLSKSLQAKISAADLVQDTMLQAIRRLSTFRGKTEADFYCWIVTILRRRVIYYVRQFAESDKRNVARESRLTNQVKTDEETPDDILEQREEAQQLNSKISQLSQNLRLVVRLRINGHSFEDIAQLLSCTRGRTQRMWQEALHQLQAKVA